MRNFVVAAAFALALTNQARAATVLNEFLANPPGADPPTQDVELLGTPDTGFDYWIISIESDGFNGLVDRASNITGIFDSNGLAVVNIGDLENPSFTLALLESVVADPTGSDLDPDNDGNLDLSGLGTALDALGVPDSTSDEAATTAYASQLNGISLINAGGEPEVTFREAATGDWYANWTFGAGLTDASGVSVDPLLFDADPALPTFGATNPTIAIVIPEPSSLVALAVAGVAGAIRRRRGQ